MKNVVLDLMMGLICLAMTITIFGMFFVSDVMNAWKEMRTE